MSAPRDLDRQIQSFLAEGPMELPDASYDEVRDRIEQKRQRAFIGPWRTPDVSNLLKIGLAAAAAVLVIVVGMQFLGGPNTGSPGASESAEPSATAAPSVAAPSQTPSPPPPLTETFTSDRNGLSMSYPAGWLTRPATEPWTTGLTDFFTPGGDVVYDPVRQSNLWIAVASQPIGDSTPDAWTAEKLASDDGCETSEPTAVDGATGLVGTNGCARAAVTIDGRGYFFWLYTSGDDPVAVAAYDRAWFDEVLATVQLQPEDAVDVAPSSSP